MRALNVLATIIVLAPAASSAEIAFSDMYFGGFGGAAFGTEAKGKNDTLFPPNTAFFDFDPDGEYIAGLVFGARVSRNVRAEVELSYANSDVDGTILTAATPIAIPASGNLSSTSLMVNGWYEIETNSTWRPYLGGGIGYTNVDADVDSSSLVSSVHDSDGGFSYQIGFGVTFPVGKAGTIDIGYRYRETRGLEFVSDSTTSAAYDDVDFKVQTIQIGYNVRF